jgi:LAS superfamily LD-carboxypeptidase LdcB
MIEVYAVKKALFSVCLLLVLIGCSQQSNDIAETINSKPNSTNVAKNQMHELSEKQLEELKPIAKKLFSDYLDSEEKSSVPSDRQIKDFKIHDDIQIFKNEENSYFIMTYDTLAATKSFVVAGGGEIDKNGWLINRNLYVELIKDNGENKLKIIGTGP